MASLVTHPSLDSEPFQLNCLVLGDHYSRVFPVEIAGTMTVGTLNDVIKDRNMHAFQRLDAKSLLLWKVSIPVDDGLNENIDNLELAVDESLSPVEELWESFPGGPAKKHVHIVIKAPAVELETCSPPQQV
jgi:hypothetical protein